MNRCPSPSSLSRACSSSALLLVALSACNSPPSAPPSPPRAASAASPAAAPSFEAPSRIPALPRIVAIGDLHGDLDATRAVLRLAGAIDEKDHWAGGNLMVLQTGDQIDRGDADRTIVDLFDRLAEEAKPQGGSVVALNGNHEVMNVSLDFRYVTPGSFKDFANVSSPVPKDPRLLELPEEARPRGAAFLPGGPYAKRLAKHPVVVVVGDTVFVHGGILPKHVRYGLDRMNREVSAWMDGTAQIPNIATVEDGPLWNRRYSAASDPEDCRVLREALAMIPAKRMVVGHTPQRNGINSACNADVWRIDVGLAKVYAGKPEVLEIAGDNVRAIGR